MKYLLDTCALSYFFRKDPNVLMHFKGSSPDDLAFSYITTMEIEYGLRLHQEREIKIRPIWEEITNLIKMLSFGEKEACYVGALRAHLKRDGKPVGAYDLLIGATAKVNQLILITSNVKEFALILDLKIKNWKEN